MITLEDCLALCELSEEEIDPIAEHEHLPEMVALELGNYLLHTAKGRSRIRHWIRDEIHDARRHDDALRSAKLNCCSSISATATPSPGL